MASEFIRCQSNQGPTTPIHGGHGVHNSMTQGLCGSKRGNDTILGGHNAMPSQLTLRRKANKNAPFSSSEINKMERIPPRLNEKKRILWPFTRHVERKPMLALFTTNSTFHSFYSLSWQLLPTWGNSLESNCQESTALVFRE